MKTELALTFNTGMFRRDEPLVIYSSKHLGPVTAESTIARMIHPKGRGIGFAKAKDTGMIGTFPLERLDYAVKMTISPEMWNLLSEIDTILDSIQSHNEAYRIIGLLDGEGLLEKHKEIKTIRDKAKKIGRDINLDYGD
tara:strand:- start:1311 stop:1727 length:417 start_codon:yes stop_codon:yes gene_type:complete